METFKGSGVRLDGKKKKDSQLDMPVVKKVVLFYTTKTYCHVCFSYTFHSIRS